MADWQKWVAEMLADLAEIAGVVQIQLLKRIKKALFKPHLLSYLLPENFENCCALRLMADIAKLSGKVQNSRGHQVESEMWQCLSCALNSLSRKFGISSTSHIGALGTSFRRSF